MAIKTQSELLATIAAFAATHTEAEYKAILTDMVDTFYNSSDGQGRIYAFASQDLDGDTAFEHDLSSTIMQVYVDLGTTIAKPDHTYVDADNITIHWVGAAVTGKTVFLQKY